MAGAADVLEAGTPDRRRRRWPAAALAAVVVAAGAVAADDWRRGQEVGELRAAVTDAEGSVAYARWRLVATEQYSSPSLSIADIGPDARSSVEQVVQRAAGDGVVTVASARARVESVPLLPWHTATDAARADYLGYLDAVSARFARIEHDHDALYSRGGDLVRRHDTALAALSSVGAGSDRRGADPLG